MRASGKLKEQLHEGGSDDNETDPVRGIILHQWDFMPRFSDTSKTLST